MTTQIEDVLKATRRLYQYLLIVSLITVAFSMSLNSPINKELWHAIDLLTDFNDYVFLSHRNSQTQPTLGLMQKSKKWFASLLAENLPKRRKTRTEGTSRSFWTRSSIQIFAQS